LDDIKELQSVCEAERHFELKLNWDMLRDRAEGEKNDLFHYEDGKLVGFIGLYGFGSKVEVCGMIHPDYRRRGIFTRLFEEAGRVIRERGFTKVLLNAPASSESAKGFLSTVPCTYAFSEHQMKWQPREMARPTDVVLRPATPDDRETEIQLDVSAFGEPEADARAMAEQSTSLEQHYMVDFEGQTVGKMRIEHNDGVAWIYGFAIAPEHQHKGIGRKALTLAVLQEHEAGYPIFLDVEAKNARALGLYESCGFKAYHAQDYYEAR
jgi:ribosomal protein S18 acetylase RimI-like enzyme